VKSGTIERIFDKIVHVISTILSSEDFDKEEKMKTILMGMVFLGLFLTGCGVQPAPVVSHNGIAVYDPWARAAGRGEATAAFMTIKNTGTEQDSLLSATCDATMMVQIMDTRIENDKMAMFDVPSIDFPAGSTVELKSGSYHVMLMNLPQEMKAGSTISITLVFAKSGEITFEVPVRDQETMQ
jgi:copper(I)-binding protein